MRLVGTMGGVIGLVLMPRVRKCDERDQGIEVISGIIGHGSKGVSLSVRWEGSERTSGGRAASLGRRNETKWAERSRSLVESCERILTLGKEQEGMGFTSWTVPSSIKSRTQSTAMTVA